VAETLELVGLADKADRPIKGFSGGERQRLGIAQAQVNYPDLLILDEPAASLNMRNTGYEHNWSGLAAGYADR
jgi:ABC-2 type transport system ATP-binding protein